MAVLLGGVHPDVDVEVIVRRVEARQADAVVVLRIGARAQVAVVVDAVHRAT